MEQIDKGLKQKKALIKQLSDMQALRQQIEQQFEQTKHKMTPEDIKRMQEHLSQMVSSEKELEQSIHQISHSLEIGENYLDNVAELKEEVDIYQGNLDSKKEDVKMAQDDVLGAMEYATYKMEQVQLSPSESDTGFYDLLNRVDQNLNEQLNTLKAQLAKEEEKNADPEMIKTLKNNIKETENEIVSNKKAKENFIKEDKQTKQSPPLMPTTASFDRPFAMPKIIIDEAGELTKNIADNAQQAHQQIDEFNQQFLEQQLADKRRLNEEILDWEQKLSEATQNGAPAETISFVKDCIEHRKMLITRIDEMISKIPTKK